MESISKIDSFDILNKINMLSLPLAKEASDYIDFLLKEKNNKNSKQKIKAKKPLKAGFAKGYFVMKPDFDEPLDDFQDYM
jgi:hypothetical protein